jgi:hypothetical protein
MKCVLMTREAAEVHRIFCRGSGDLGYGYRRSIRRKDRVEGQMWARREKMEALRSGISLRGFRVIVLAIAWKE